MTYRDPVTRRRNEREYAHRYREAHLDAVRARDRVQKAARYPAHRDAILARRRARRAERADIVRAQTRASYARHIERRRADARARRPRTEAEKARLAAYQREHLRRNPAYYRHRQALRRARRYGNGGTHTLAEWQEKVVLLGGCCAYCGRSDVRLYRDHKIPLVRGGTDAIENIVPACGSCNRAKYTKTAVEFLGLERSA